MSSTIVTEWSTGTQSLREAMNDMLSKLRDEPDSITTEDARRLAENAMVSDLRTAKIVSAVEAFALANEDAHEVDPQLGQAPHTSLLTMINDLKIAVEQNPAGITDEVLKTAQTVVSEMQRAVGYTTALHPELELELQEDTAKIEPKLTRGIATLADTKHLHSCEARAYGHRGEGRLTSTAQFHAAKRERHESLSDQTNLSGQGSMEGYKQRTV